MNCVKRVISVCLVLVLSVPMFSATAINAFALSENARYYESIPETVYATVDEPFEIYYKNILSLPDMQISFTVPQDMTKKYFSDRIEITAHVSGDYEISWRVYDREYILVDSGTMTLSARTRELKDATVLVMGDSTVNAGVVTQSMLDFYEENGKKLTLLGTKGVGENLHEGRSGWRSYDYCESETNRNEANPFYNNGFDFSYYMESQGYESPDVVVVQIGINDIKRLTLEEYSNEKSLESFSQIISSIHSYNPEISVVLSVPVLPNINEESYNGNINIVTPFEYRNNIIHFASDLLEKFENTENVYISAPNCSIDSANEIEDAIHPTNDGYSKIAKSHIETINYIYNKEIESEPTKITSGEFKNGEIHLSWVKMPGVERYAVIREDYGILTETQESTFSDTNVESGNVYKYVVRTYFTDGYVYDSEGFKVTIIDEPVLKSAENATKGVQVKWNEVNGAESYVVYRKTAGTSWKKLGTVKSTSFVDTKVVSGIKYLYTVRASLDSVLSSYDKAGVSVYYLATPALSSITNNSGSVKVTWEKVSGAKGYYVYRKTSKKGKWVKVASVKGTSYTDKDVKSGGNYYYTVRAYNGKNLSYYVSGGIATKYLNTPKLSKVTSKKNGVTLTYGKVAGATDYYIYRKTGKGSWKKIATVSGNNQTSYLDKTAKKGVTYTYTVRAVNGKYKSYYNTKGLTIKDKY